MKLICQILIILIPLAGFSQNRFDQYFSPNTFRFDFQLGGNSQNKMLFPEQMKREPFWGGSHRNMVSPFNYGNYRYCVYDRETNKQIYSKGFCPLFHEWQSTEKAKTEWRTFYNVITFPFPKKEFRLEIESRNRDGQFETIFSNEINPNDYFILNENLPKMGITRLIKNGSPSKKVDIAILAEGYTQMEMDEFIQDAIRLVNNLFEVEPFLSMKDRFNINLIHSLSEESGTDVPGERIFRNTIMDFSFYTFDEPRYITTNNLKTMYDLAAIVPYDQIYVLINSNQYGGGGFYNFYNSCTADHELSKFVFVHELGHGFAGLGDEYYTSTVPLLDFYNLKIEPWEPNLTTLINFKTKWEHLLEDSIPIPTPRQREFENKAGVFEGGGYHSKGMYSPMMNCIMKSSNAPTFCPVCQDAIRKMILFHSE